MQPQRGNDPRREENWLSRYGGLGFKEAVKWIILAIVIAIVVYILAIRFGFTVQKISIFGIIEIAPPPTRDNDGGGFGVFIENTRAPSPTRRPTVVRVPPTRVIVPTRIPTQAQVAAFCPYRSNGIIMLANTPYVDNLYWTETYIAWTPAGIEYGDYEQNTATGLYTYNRQGVKILTSMRMGEWTQIIETFEVCWDSRGVFESLNP